MLGKLFKYDFKALAKVLLPVHVALLLVIAVGVLSGVYAGLGDASTYSYSVVSGQRTFSVLKTISLCVFFFCMLLYVVAYFATWVVIIHRYYKNFFTDEGYLTFTLPVKARTLFASKVLASIVWLLIDLLLLYAGGVLTICVIEGNIDYAYRVVQFIGMFAGFSTYSSDINLLWCILWFAFQFIGLLANLLLVFCCFTISGCHFNKKALWGIVLAVCVFIGVGIVTSVTQGSLLTPYLYGTQFASQLDYAQTMQLSSIINTVIQVVLAVIFTFISCKELKKNVNLT